MENTKDVDEYKCSVCGFPATIEGKEIVRTCDHTDPVLVRCKANLTVKGTIIKKAP